MTGPAEEPADDRCLMEAAAWRIHLTEHDEDESLPDFQRWLQADPGNAAAWQAVNQPWQLFAEQPTAPELMAARREALADAQQTAGKRFNRRGMLQVSLRWVSVAAALLLVVGVGLLWQSSQPEVYQTAAGERRTFMLEDGSSIALDARSEVHVRYTRAARELQLMQGQAQFDVARDAARRFVVTAQDRQVIATGTSFNVELISARLLVTLIEGRVLVVPQTPATANAGERQPLMLAVGERLLVDEQGREQVSAVDLEQALAWQSGRLIVKNESLQDLASRFNRYSRRTIHIRDPEVAALRISGVFRMNDSDSFIDTIQAYLPVAAHPGADGDIELVSSAR